MAQQLAGIAHETLFKVFLDVRKAYNSLDRGQCMDILREYSMVKNMACLINHHWDNLIFVPRVERFLGTAFVTGRGVIKGNLASSMIFNIMVNTVVIVVLEIVCGPHEARHGMGWATGERNLVFYADDGKITGRYHIWVQDVLTVTVVMLRRGGIDTNLKKDKGSGISPRLHLG